LNAKPNHYRYVEYVKLAILGVHYVPYLFFLDFRSTTWVYFTCGVYITGAMAIRNLWFGDRLSTHVRGLWVLADTCIWILGQWATGWNELSFLAVVLGTDAAMNGWRYRRGLPHLAAVTVLFLVGLWATSPRPLRISDWHMVLYQTTVFFLFIHGFVYMAATIRGEQEEAALARAAAEEVAVLRERNRLARDVHDTIAHAFTGIIMQLEAARLILADDPAMAGGRLAIIQERARDGLDELRRSVHALRPLHLEQRPGLSAVVKLVEEFQVSTGVETTLHVTGTPWELPAGYDLCQFRSVQEGLSNALRHGRARRVQVLIAYSPADLTLTVEDDGAGATDPGQGGLGLVGIRERAELLGGSVTAGPLPGGRGFRLQVSLPRHA
jgi:signal transduction histidine kinase